MKVFVVHYKKLVQRKISIINQFAAHNINDYEFIEIDRDELQNHDQNMFAAEYSNPQRAITLSHFYAYKQIADMYDSALIVEDDILLSSGFMASLTRYLTELPADYDMLFLGDGCGLHIPQTMLIKDKHIYKKTIYPTPWGGNGATRCTDSYVISKHYAKKLCDYIQHLPYKINQPIDWWLNTAARDTLSTVYWAEPTIVTQGTQNGVFKTSY